MKAFWYNETRKNMCGTKIREYRKKKNMSIEKLATNAQIEGYDLTANTITKIELGIRFVPDYEVAIFAKLLNTTPDELLTEDSGARNIT